MAESDFSEDANVVVIPVDDSLSDGKRETWPLNDPKYKYRAVDDTKWREALAEMWIEDTGAKEEGKFNGDYSESQNLGGIWGTTSVLVLLFSSHLSPFVW